MKIAFITDTHFGARNDAPLFLDHFLDFFEKQFFPYLEEHGIKTIIHLGDLMDRRKFVNFHTLNQVRKRFIQKLKDGNYEMYCIAGNHDTYFRNTNDINSLRELFHNEFKIYDFAPAKMNFGGVDFIFVPWLNKANNEMCLEFIKNNSADFILGHFEFAGYQVLRGVKHEEGTDPSLFSKFEHVYSGHFHCKQTDKNISYLGTPYQITFGDVNERKGFHVFDTDTRIMEFVPNKSKMFYIIRYNDKDEDPMGIDFTDYRNKFVKVIVESKTKPYLFDRFMDSLYGAQVANVTVAEEQTGDILSVDKVDASLDTVSIINNEIDSMQEVQNKEKLKKIIHELYIESLSSQEI